MTNYKISFHSGSEQNSSLVIPIGSRMRSFNNASYVILFTQVKLVRRKEKSVGLIRMVLIGNKLLNNGLNALSAHYLPDGNEIVFDAFYPDNYEIYTINSDGSDLI